VALAEGHPSARRQSDLALQRRSVKPEDNGFELVAFAGGVDEADASDEAEEDEELEQDVKGLGLEGEFRFMDIWSIESAREAGQDDSAPGDASEAEEAENPYAWKPALARQVLEAHAGALERLEESLARPDFQVPRAVRLDDAMPYLLCWRDLTTLLEAQARLFVDEKRPKEALEVAFDLMEFGRRIFESEGVLITALVGLSIESRGLNVLARALAHDGLDKRDLVEAAKRLRGRPLDLNALDDVWRAEFHAESGTIENIPSLLGRSEVVWLWKSLVHCPNETTAMLAESFRTLIANSSLPPAKRRPFRNAKARSLNVAGLKIPLVLRNYPGRAIHDSSMPSRFAVIGLIDNHRLQHAGAQVLIALRRHQLDRGELPAGLESLVPEFLDAVPLDPYDGKPLRYAPERRLLYSVGNDFIDANGVPAARGLSKDLPPPGQWDFKRLDEPTMRIPFYVGVSRAPSGPAPPTRAALRSRRGVPGSRTRAASPCRQGGSRGTR
jgi:hypothetical protein